MNIEIIKAPDIIKLKTDSKSENGGEKWVGFWKKLQIKYQMS
ncbi:hypothetical protein CLOBOL_07267 [Enterocloster bolteae ATCC BAA-613]|uniref:Uncharacterized protein n=1 Tax=Enterocloster bolteae (strain ATCC BAA-613 / DSM 15670 / CCUG 46953 / JCM 12243 / WAL 16351) TaxID=411902 RepID=A8S5N8_ENTBW|nr:hypothetical protein CLOBOL_07267 [Enterocloster bolteae ATCC BAA-613]